MRTSDVQKYLIFDVVNTTNKSNLKWYLFYEIVDMTCHNKVLIYLIYFSLKISDFKNLIYMKIDFSNIFGNSTSLSGAWLLKKKLYFTSCKK